MGESLDNGHSENTLHPGFAALARWILANRLVTFLVVVAITGGALYQIATHGLILDNRPEVFATKDSPAVLALKDLREEFGRDDLFVILLEGDVFSKPFLTRLKALEDEIETLDLPSEDSAAAPAEETTEEGEDDWGDEWDGEEGGTIVAQITSLFSVRETRPSEDGIVVGTPLDAWPDISDLDALKESITTNRQYLGRLIDPEGRHTTIIVQTDMMNEERTNLTRKKLVELLKPHRHEDFKIWLAGIPVLGTTLNELTLTDTARLTGLAAILITIFLTLIFRHFIGVIGPFLVIQLSILLSLGLMATLGYSVNVLTTILPAFLVIVAVGDSVHMQSVYRDVRKTGVDNDEAIVHALGITGMPMLFTTLTTSVGLLSFKMASLDAIGELGVAGAFGVTGAFVITVLLIPICLSFNQKSMLGARTVERGFDFLDGILIFCNRLSGTARSPFGGKPTTPEQTRRRLITTLVIGTAIVLMSIYLARFIEVKHDPLKWLDTTFEVRQGFDLMDATVGGTAQIILMLEPSSAKGLRDLDFINRLEDIEQRILGYKHEGWDKPLVTSAISVLDIIRETNQALHGGDPAYFKIPDTERGLSDVLFLFENASPDQLRKLATTDLSKSQVTFNIHWLPATEYQPLADEVAAHIQELFPTEGEVRTTGVVYSMLSTIGLLVRDLTRSFGLAFIVITIMMILLLKDLKLGLIAMVPNLTPILALLSIMVGFSVPLDMSTLMVFSIAIGICVDDTIHFIHHFQIHYRETSDTEASITEALKHGGRAICITSIVLISGLGVQMTAQIDSIALFGALVATTIALALIADLMFAPAVLRVFYPKKKEEA